MTLRSPAAAAFYKWFKIRQNNDVSKLASCQINAFHDAYRNMPLNGGQEK